MIIATNGSNTLVHDPTLVKEGGIYYLFSTGNGVSIRCSKDMQTWETCGQVFTNYPAWVKETIPGVEALWAPEVVLHNRIYYLVYSASTFASSHSALGLATNITLDPNHPDYHWVDQGMLIASVNSSNYNAIDPNLVFGLDGQPWLVFGSFWSGIQQVKLDPQTFKPAAGAPLRVIASREGANAVDGPKGNNAIEGAFVTYRDGYFYLFAAYDFCCRGKLSNYNIRVTRSKYITGPYVDKDGMDAAVGGSSMVFKGSPRWIGPGHNSIYIENGTYYMVYHAYDGENDGIPTLQIETLDWDTDGWPVSPSALLYHP
jgi:arabinan endo-1,5-alpha-L-arabinosidase